MVCGALPPVSPKRQILPFILEALLQLLMARKILGMLYLFQHSNRQLFSPISAGGVRLHEVLTWHSSSTTAGRFLLVLKGLNRPMANLRERPKPNRRLPSLGLLVEKAGN